MKKYYERIHVRKWNSSSESTMLILPEKEIQSGSEMAFAGANWEIIVVPHKYETEKNDFVEFGIKIAKMRGGRVIYI